MLARCRWVHNTWAKDSIIKVKAESWLSSARSLAVRPSTMRNVTQAVTKHTGQAVAEWIDAYVSKIKQRLISRKICISLKNILYENVDVF